MKIETILTKKDYRSFQIFSWFKYRKFHWVILILWLPSCYSYWNDEYNSTSDRIITTILSGVILLFMVAFGMTFLFLFFKILKRGYQQVLGKHVFEILNGKLIESNESSRTETNISMLKKIFVEKNHIFVMQKNGATHIIPRRAFKNQKQEDSFIETINKKIA